MDITSTRRRSCHCADARGQPQGKNGAGVRGEPKGRECHTLFHPDTHYANCDRLARWAEFPEKNAGFDHSVAPFGGEGCVAGWRPVVRAGVGSRDPRTAEAKYSAT